MTTQLVASKALNALTAAFGLLSLLAACGGGGSGTATPATPAAVPATSAVCAARRTLTGHDVVLLIGQSNMVGYGAYYNAGFDLTDPRIEQLMRTGEVKLAQEPLDHPNFPFNVGRVGPGLSFARAYLKTLPSNRKILLVPAAQGGSGFSDSRWNPGDDLFEAALSRTNAGLAINAPGNCLAAILWSEGEIDAINGMSGSAYQSATDRLINTLRSRITGGTGADTAPFVLGQFSPDWTTANPTPQQLAILSVINATPTRQRFTSVVSTAGLTSNLTQGLDGAIHLDAASQRIYGVRYNDALPAAVANSAPR